MTLLDKAKPLQAAVAVPQNITLVPKDLVDRAVEHLLVLLMALQEMELLILVVAVEPSADVMAVLQPTVTQLQTEQLVMVVAVLL